MFILKRLQHRFHKILTRLTIRKEILASLLLTAFLTTTIVGFYGGCQIKVFLEDEKISYNRELVRQAGRKLDYLAEDISIAQKQLIIHSISSPLFYQYEDLPILDRIKYIKNLNGYLDTLRQAFPFVHAIYIIDNKYRVYSNLIEFDRDELLSSEWLEELEDEHYGLKIIPLHKAPYSVASTSDPVPWTISIIRKVSRMGNKDKSAIIQIDLDEQLISETLDHYPLNDNGYLQIVDENQQIIATSIEKTGHNFSNTDKMQKYSFPLENFNWTLVSYIHPVRFLTENMLSVWTYIILILSVLIFSVFFSIVISRRITGPLNNVLDAMETMGRGNFNQRLPEGSNTDLRSLVRGINRMNDHLQILVSNISRKEKERNKAQINALQAQINPHFLYNTLDVIRGISQAKGNKDVVNITASLAKIFRYSIGSKELVSVSDELENVKHYVKIQEYRFGDRFRVEYNINEHILKSPIVKLILQPLVENAFKHGVEDCRKEGFLLISGVISGENIIISIENNGPMVDQEKIDELNNSFYKDQFMQKEFAGHGVGLYNVDSRLKLHFGLSSGLEIKQRNGGGIIVTLNFPNNVYREKQ